MAILGADDGYAALFEDEKRWLAGGRKPAGYKVGLTTPTAQKFFGADGPSFGLLFEDMRVADGATIAHGRFSRPRIEAEIAFRIGQGPAGEETLTDAIESVIPAIEIVESRYANGPAGMGDLIADNTSGAGFALGDPIPFEPSLDLEGCCASTERNGTAECEGFGRACLGSPLLALEWLVGALAAHGRALSAGDIVLAGSLIVPFEALPGDAIHARFTQLGDVSCAFSEATDRA